MERTALGFKSRSEAKVVASDTVVAHLPLGDKGLVKSNSSKDSHTWELN